MGTSIPACYGSYVNDDLGLLLLGDVSAAIRGDELVTCGREGAVGLIQAVANARVGPPAVDVAVMLFSLAFSDAAPLQPTELIDVYASELAKLGRARDRGN